MISITIKDIAALAGVSVSTVSKILNDKADSISEETKQRVLEIAKQHNYTPYAGLKNLYTQKKYLVGCICSATGGNLTLIEAIRKVMAKNNYDIVLFDPRDDDRFEHIDIIENKVDGLIIFPETGKDIFKRLKKSNLPMVMVNADTDQHRSRILCNYNYQQAVSLALELLYSYHHQKIGILAEDPESHTAKDMLKSFDMFYRNNNLPYDHNWFSAVENTGALLHSGVTAIICENENSLTALKEIVTAKGITIPDELSVVLLGKPFYAIHANITYVDLNTDELGAKTAHTLIALMENSSAKTLYQINGWLHRGNTVTSPYNKAFSRPILVLGTLNNDVLMDISGIPNKGETTIVKNILTLPGGKGGNQAVGVAKLGGQVNLIGNIGNDSDGKLIYSTLKAHNIDTRGVYMDDAKETGKAYINIAPTGESFIQVYTGANNNLNFQQINDNIDMFQEGCYFLVQSEMQNDALDYAIKTAYKRHMKIVMKPCTIREMPPNWLKMLDIIVPNRQEAKILAGEDKTLSQQADFFLEGGCKQVIITLDEEGCFCKNQEAEFFIEGFLPEGSTVVDTTGGSDAFIAALVVKLNRGATLKQAARYANIAAGISVTRRGVQVSMADEDIMQIYTNTDK